MVFSFMLAFGYCEYSTGSEEGQKLIATSNSRNVSKNIQLKQFGLLAAMTKNNFTWELQLVPNGKIEDIVFLYQFLSRKMQRNKPIQKTGNLLNISYWNVSIVKKNFHHGGIISACEDTQSTFDVQSHQSSDIIYN